MQAFRILFLPVPNADLIKESFKLESLIKEIKALLLFFYLEDYRLVLESNKIKIK